LDKNEKNEAQFVRKSCVCFFNPQQCWALKEIGFVWLCFSGFGRAVYYHKLLSNKMLRSFVPTQIGFVFSKHTRQIISDLDIRI
jgi:hypothetical protein